MVILKYLRLLAVTNKSSTFYLSFSSSLPAGCGTALYCWIPIEIFSLDTIQRDDVDGEPFRLGNRKGNMNSGHEKEKGGNSKARGQGLIRSHGKHFCCRNDSSAYLAELKTTTNLTGTTCVCAQCDYICGGTWTSWKPILALKKNYFTIWAKFTKFPWPISKLACSVSLCLLILLKI